jgi:sugar phosphate permease
MIRKYVLPAQRSTSAAIVTAACYLGALSSNLLSPMIISHFSWESCFLLFAAIPPLIWIPLWALFLGRKGVGISGPSSEENTEYLISKISSDSNINYIENGKNSEVDGSYVKSSRKVPVSESTTVGATSPQRTLTYADVTSEQSTTQSTYAAESTYSSENLQICLAEEVCESDIVSDTVPLISSNSEKEGKGKIRSIERGDRVQKQKQKQEQEQGAKQDKTLSIRTLLKSPPVWAIIAAQYGQSWGAIGLLSWLPTYYSKRFNVPFESLSEFTVLPYFLQMIVGVSAGFLADKLIGSGVRTLLVRNILQITGMLVPAVCLALCAYLPSISSAQAAILITSGSAISALTVAAVSANHFDISPENAGTIYGIGNTAGCIGKIYIYVYIRTYIYIYICFIFMLVFFLYSF